MKHKRQCALAATKEMSISKVLEKSLSWHSNITRVTQAGCETFSFLDFQSSSEPVTSHLDLTLSEGV